ncbi:hypothetical protein [Streptomyces sp. NPDC048603]|uniref:hypothetical protein n=1 Tax=Streptomyces sp. NPDC048603 TaxID=3365577 RepID=UPI00371FE2D7
MARSSSGIVAGLTAVALGAVGFLAYQASASAPERKPAAVGQPGPPAPNRPAPAADPAKPLPVPADSGTGKRVVYSVGLKRVWLVEAAEGSGGANGAPGAEPRTFAVVPSTVHPKPGGYAVTSRSGAVTGSDGVPIEHVVRFTSAEGVVVGFSARVDGSLPAPDAKKKTGGIRMSRADGDAVWAFATISTKVVVVP